MIRVLIVDDQELVRQGLATILGAEPDLEIVGEANDGVEAITLTRQVRPDVVLMDVRMPRLDGIQATERIMAELPDCRVLVLTTFDVDDGVLAAIRAGASGYLLKDTPRRSLVASVRAVAAGEVLIDREVAARLIAGPVPRSASAEGDQIRRRLTQREAEVLDAVARGLSNAEIAEELLIGEATVKTHLAHLLEKSGARDRIQLVVMAHRGGLAGS